MDMRRVLTVLAVCVFAYAAPAPAGAQENPPEEIVIVTPERLETLVRGFVDELTTEGGQIGQLPRWRELVCPGVVGLRAAYAQAIVDRIAEHAISLGLQVGEPGCRANLLILFTDEAERLALALYDQHRQALGYSRGTTRGREALRRFIERPRSVRWWHVSVAATRDGVLASTLEGGGPVVIDRRPIEARTLSTQQVFASAILIVDVARVREVRLVTLADYLSMAALAQLEPDADTSGYPTILNALQDDDDAPGELTTWDIAYLEGLYGARWNRPAASQRETIVQSILDAAE